VLCSSMGCSGSKSATPVNAICRSAFENKKSINHAKLRSEVAKLDVALLNSKDEPWDWTALDFLALSDVSLGTGVAAEILLSAGADPFCGSTDFKKTAFEKCIKYSNLAVLGPCLDKLDAPGWDTFTTMLASKKKGETHAGIGENVWVQVGGKKGKTGITPSTGHGVDRNAPKSVSFEDGSSAFPSPGDITILPQAESSVLEFVFTKVSDRQEQMNKDMLLERIKSCEEADRVINGEWKCNFRRGH